MSILKINIPLSNLRAFNGRFFVSMHILPRILFQVLMGSNANIKVNRGRVIVSNKSRRYGKNNWIKIPDAYCFGRLIEGAGQVIGSGVSRPFAAR